MQRLQLIVNKGTERDMTNSIKIFMMIAEMRYDCIYILK